LLSDALSVGNTLEVLGEFRQPLLWVVENRSKQKGLRSAGVLAAFALAIAGASHTEGVRKIKGWFECLNSGNGIEAGGALARLRAFLVGE